MSFSVNNNLFNVVFNKTLNYYEDELGTDINSPNAMFFHNYNTDGTNIGGGSCFALEEYIDVDENNNINYVNYLCTVAHCSPKDTYSRKEGKVIVSNRMNVYRENINLECCERGECYPKIYFDNHHITAFSFKFNHVYPINYEEKKNKPVHIDEITILSNLNGVTTLQFLINQYNQCASYINAQFFTKILSKNVLNKDDTYLIDLFNKKRVPHNVVNIEPIEFMRNPFYWKNN